MQLPPPLLPTKQSPSATVSTVETILPPKTEPVVARARRTGTATKTPLFPTSGPSNSALTSTSVPAPILATGKENRDPIAKIEVKSETVTSVRSRLERRKARRLGQNYKVTDSVIDLTGDDEEMTSPLPKAEISGIVTNVNSLNESPPKPLPSVPWRMGPVPHILYSSKTLDGEVMDTYPKLKSRVASKLKSLSVPPTSIPECPPLPAILSDTTLPSSSTALDAANSSRSVKVQSDAGPSGLKRSNAPISAPVALSESDDETPLDQLLPTKTSLRNYVAAPGKKPSSSPPIVYSSPTFDPAACDPTIRKSNRRKRPYLPK